MDMDKEVLKIEELPIVNWNIDEYYQFNDIELLDYVFEVADEYLPNLEAGNPSCAPAIFYNRYMERNLTIAERYERHKMFFLSNETFEEYQRFHLDYRRLNDSFKDIYLNNRDLQLTMKAFKLDVSKLWYLLLFVYDYIEDIGTNAPTVGKTILDDFNNFITKLDETTGIVLKKNGRKCHETDREDTIKVIQSALQYYVKSYNAIVDCEYTDDVKKEKLKEMGGIVNGSTHPLSLDGVYNLPITYKKWKFADMFTYFMKDRKAKTIHKNESRDRLLFISRLIYTVGYEGSEHYNKEYIEDYKNRLLSNLLRKYRHEQFPIVSGKYYMR